MLHAPDLIPPQADFWHRAAEHILRGVERERLGPMTEALHPQRLTSLRVVVPCSYHVPLLKAALAETLGMPVAAPRILTMQHWLAMQPPEEAEALPATDGERTMALYAELRKHAWLKSMFSARRNADLLPLARTLIALSDELTCTMLPLIRRNGDEAHARWTAALEQLPPPARKLLSEETELVWSVWKSQLDLHDPLVWRFNAMLRLAERAAHPLVWIGAVEPNPLEKAFLEAYAARQPVMHLLPDWRPGSVDPLLRLAWPALCSGGPEGLPTDRSTPPALALAPARSLESEAVQAAQTVVDWLEAGCQSIAIVSQDRAVARRTRALLERAGIQVADEIGWKLSTTRAAASVGAWFDVVASHGQTAALLDFLKSPFILASEPGRPSQVMDIELALRRNGVRAGWNAMMHAVARLPEARSLLERVHALALPFSERRTLQAWRSATRGVLTALDMQQAMEQDEAGAQVVNVIDAAARSESDAVFSFSEWRAVVGMQLESTYFIPSTEDRRVSLLPLSETRLRRFDAALIIGADARHLPSQTADQLFFANSVRRELGLRTREDRQCQEMRDLASLVQSVPRLVLSWQEWRNDEPNAVSPWIMRLAMALRMLDLPALRPHRTGLSRRAFERRPMRPPAPRAPHRLPERLSASAFGRLMDCPYQFFALSMLGLVPLEEAAELPEKRDYGDWVHEILHRFHERLRDTAREACRAALLNDVTEEVFGPVLEQHGAALAYHVRWRAAAPAYLEWLASREADGWRYVSGETRFERVLDWPGGQITLHGRIDRIDTHEDGSRAVIDYKTSSPKTLKDKMSAGEDVQLAFYGLLCDGGFDAAHYLPVELSGNAIEHLEAKDYARMTEALEGRIADCMQAIAEGGTLAANGIETICQYCTVRGLCRKGSWS